MNKILVENSIKCFRIFYCSVAKQQKLIRKDKVKEFVKSLKNELFDLKKNINKKETLNKVNEFKKKYFMINENNNILEYDFFNDEIIHQKLLNFLTQNKDVDKISITHEIEVMESILDCYYERCSLNVDYSDMSFTKNENAEMKKILDHYEIDFENLKKKFTNNENIFSDGINLIKDLNCLLILSSKISAKTSTILFGQILVNNIFRAFLKIFYSENIEYLECENKFFLTDVKKSDYFKNITKNSVTNIEKIIDKFTNEFGSYLDKFPELNDMKLHLGKCIEEIEGGA